MTNRQKQEMAIGLQQSINRMKADSQTRGQKQGSKTTAYEVTEADEVDRYRGGCDWCEEAFHAGQLVQRRDSWTYFCNTECSAAWGQAAAAEYAAEHEDSPSLDAPWWAYQ